MDCEKIREIHSSDAGGNPPFNTDESEKIVAKLMQMMKQNICGSRFLWCVSENAVYEMGDPLFPKDVTDPLDFMRENAMIEQSFEPAFDVFCARIEEGIVGGSEQPQLEGLNIDISMRLSDSEPYRMCHIYTMFLHDGEGRITDIYAEIMPFSTKERLDREIVEQFSSDKNPKLYTRQLREMIDNNPDKNIAFIQFDVERFKVINDTYGVEKGDALLRFLSDSLGVICTSEQPFCRLTADVFMVVTAFDTKDTLVEFIHRLESMLCGYDGMDYRLVFGVSIVDDRKAHTRRFGDNAGIARQSVKGNALNNIGFYHGEMRDELKKQQSIEKSMENALLNGEFVMYLQPKYSISTGRIIGAEALTRWIKPKQGMVSPAEFIPVFEKNGFIVKLDHYIWEQACKKLRQWIDEGVEPVPISVNISREYIVDSGVTEKLTALVEKYKIPPRLLELEITESVDTEGIEAVVREMKNAGFTMLMDDFGSGYSSLNMLKTTQFDVLKIDREFLSEFIESERGRKIISHTISMSKDIGLDIIAEGVETGEQAQFLSHCGCDAAQGFFYSKPITPSDFDSRLAASRN